jgi:[NiFe] hydrogenase diaphorase moiety large subunit
MPKEGLIDRIVGRQGNDRLRLVDILRDVQAERGCVPPDAVSRIAERLGLSTVEVEGVATFYHFFTPVPAGRYAVYLNDNIVSVFKGRGAVAAAFEAAAGCRFGESTPDGRIGLWTTSCIGLNDQEPAALINGVPFTKLTPARARALVADMRAGRDVGAMVRDYGDGANRSRLVRSMVRNNLRRKGQVIFAPHRPGAALKAAVSRTPEEVIAEVKRANLLGRGGAGFPTGLKWEFCLREKEEPRYVVANADEGEPGTFKDRVILTERPKLLFEGMAIAGYAIGARQGLLYLRGEYAYLKPHLEKALAELRAAGLLGKRIAGKRGFDFDIAIKLGAGAYICGEESALLQSAEGARGEPRDRPPFPVQFGYLGKPTTVNNVETLCAAARVLEKGAAWFKGMGTPRSAGPKVLSVSGDCLRPGVYEVEFGITVWQLLKLAGGTEAQAVQVGGPSGTCVSRGQFNRTIGFEDLATGGSIIVIGPERDLFEVVHNFMDFFIEESCGWCAPCRAGNPILKRKLAKVTEGKGTLRDLADLEAWGKIIKAASRCGLGQTSPNPILTTLQNFREQYEIKIRRDADYVSEFDLERAVGPAASVTGQTLPPAHEEAPHE